MFEETRTGWVIRDYVGHGFTRIDTDFWGAAKFVGVRRDLELLESVFFFVLGGKMRLK
jgi:hypothetical protein